MDSCASNALLDAATESIQPLNSQDDEMYVENLIFRDPNLVAENENVNLAAGSENLNSVSEPELDHTLGPGLSAHVLSQIIATASEAATVAAIRAVTSGVTNPSSGVPVPPDNPNSNRNESEDGVLKPFKPSNRKRGVPRANGERLVDGAMRHFLKSKGVLARKGYLPDEPDKQLVKAFEENGEVGPDPKAPRVCLTQTFKGKWNKEVVEVLTAEFILAVNKGRYKHVQHSCPLMTEDEVRKRCRVKLYRTQRMCLLQRKPHRADEDKMNRIMQRRQNTYNRRTRIWKQNHYRDSETWGHVKFLLDALGTRGTSDDETDDEHTNPDPRFKTLRRVDLGFLNPAIAEIWASVESYPSKYQPARGNNSFLRIAKAKSISKREPLRGLPINFYCPKWLERSPPHFRKDVREAVTLPTLRIGTLPTIRGNKLAGKRAS